MIRSRISILFWTYKLDITARGIPQITKPTRIPVRSFVVKCFLHDFATVSLANKRKSLRSWPSWRKWVYSLCAVGCSATWEASGDHAWYLEFWNWFCWFVRSSRALNCEWYWWTLVDNGTSSVIVDVERKIRFYLQRTFLYFECANRCLFYTSLIQTIEKFFFFFLFFEILLSFIDRWN